MSSLLSEGAELGQYRIAGEIGQGPSATVYRAYQAGLDRFVAIKVVRVESEQFLRHFHEVARRLGRLRHPNIAQVYDFGEQGDLVYLVRELVEGDSLRRRIGSLSSEQAMSVMTQVASALDYAHGSGILHGDLRPSNVLLNQAGRAFVVDFAVGDAAPIEGRQADIYALALLAQQLLSGRVEPDPNEHLPAKVGPVLSRGDFPTAAALVADLREAMGIGPGHDGTGRLDVEPTLASLPIDDETRLTVSVRAAPETQKPSKRSWPALAGVIGLIIVALIGGGLVMGRPGSRGRAAAGTPALANSGALPPTTAPAGIPPATSPSSSPSSSPDSAETARLASSGASPSASAVVGPPTATPTAISNATPPIYMAISHDGANFEAAQTLPITGVFFGAFSQPRGGLRIYATDGVNGHLHAYVTADFRTWKEEPLKASQKLVVGDIVKLPEGGYRLYYLPVDQTFSVPGTPTPAKGLKSARSADGVTFEDEPGVRYAAVGLTLGTVAPLEGGWLLIASTEQNRALNTQALTSLDGLNFKPLAGAITPEGSGAPKLSSYDGKLHLLFAAIAAITSWSSTDGKSWQLDPGVRQRIDASKLSLQPAIVKTDDGVYRLIYSLVNRTAAPTPTASAK